MDQHDDAFCKAVRALQHEHDDLLLELSEIRERLRAVHSRITLVLESDGEENGVSTVGVTGSCAEEVMTKLKHERVFLKGGALESDHGRIYLVTDQAGTKRKTRVMVRVTVPNNVISLSDHAFLNCTWLEHIDLPLSVTSIGRRAFEGCSALRTATLPSKLAFIGKRAFRGCLQLHAMSLPAGVSKIWGSTFENCEGLSEVDLQHAKNLTWIGDRAFAECYSLTTVDIPVSVNEIGPAAFANCYHLKRVKDSTNCAIGSDCFTGCIQLPADALKDYQKRELTSKRRSSLNDRMKAAVAEMEKTLLQIGTDHLISTEVIKEVEGAVVLHHCLSDTECNSLTAVVQSLHRSCGWEEGRRQAVVSIEHSGVEETFQGSNVAPRRQSQHHLPCLVEQSSLSQLCERIRSYLPQIAGPHLPAAAAKLQPPGCELSNFLRCYWYREGDTSTPHYDRAWTTSSSNRLTAFSAYSLLIYLTDNLDSGGTTFFRHDPTVRLTRSGLTPVPEDVALLVPKAAVQPKRGDILIFPHGKFPGCYPDPLHEGSEVLGKDKMLIRTDILFTAPDKKYKLRNKTPYRNKLKTN